MQNKIKIIGLKGKSGAGKDTVGNYLFQRCDRSFKKLALADPLKEIISIITGWSMHMIRGESSESRYFRETVIHPEFGMTCREMLQHVGTELFRNHFDPDMWVKIARRRILEAVKENRHVVVTDIRFDNEAKMILDLGGEIWTIERDVDSSQVSISEAASQHISEREFEVEGEKTIKNNGTIEELYAKINDLL